MLNTHDREETRDARVEELALEARRLQGMGLNVLPIRPSSKVPFLKKGN